MPASWPPHSLVRTKMSFAMTSSFIWVSPCTLIVPASPRALANCALADERGDALAGEAHIIDQRGEAARGMPLRRVQPALLLDEEPRQGLGVEDLRVRS